MFLTLLFTFVPPFAILAFIFLSDKFREPAGMVFSTFVLGFLLILPAGILNEFLIFSKENPRDYVFLAGLTEETLKFAALFFFIRKRVEFNEPMDAIVYGTTISLGFATYENYEYVFLYNEDLSSLAVAGIRSVTAIPLHACCGILMGYNFGLYFLSKSKKFLFRSIAIPILLHSLYNYVDNILLMFVIIILAVITCLYLHKGFVREQRNKVSEREFN
tara:strand:- start:2310 stop:2963 length:654 start_codon:yes stop_codon:yes gene_type:complete